MSIAKNWKSVVVSAAAVVVLLSAGKTQAATVYWDLDGTTAGSGPTATPTGIWNTTNTFWNPLADGTGTTAAWVAGNTAVFSAGTDATGNYTVTVSGVNIGGMIFEEGQVTLRYSTPLSGDITLLAANTRISYQNSNLNGSVTSNITSGAASGTQTIFMYDGADFLKGDTWSGNISDGVTGGKVSVYSNAAANDHLGILTGTNTYTGETRVNFGILRANDGTSLPTNSPLTIAGRSTFETSANLVRPGGSGAGQMRLISGPANFFSGFNAVTNPVLVSFGIVGTPEALTWGSGSFQPSNGVFGLNIKWPNVGTYTPSIGADIEFNNAINLGAAVRDIRVDYRTATLSGVLSGSGGLRKIIVASAGASGTGAGTLRLTAVNTYLGNTTIQNGILEIGGAGQLGSGTYAGNVPISTGGTFKYNSSANQSMSGLISGAGSLIKDNNGVLTLSGNNSYTGTTTITAGTLLVNGNQSTANGAVSVAAGATLGGNGTIGGATTISGTHSPGNSPGIQTFSTTLTYSGGASNVNWELIDNTNVNAPNPNAIFDTIVVNSNLNFAGATALDLIFNSTGSAVDWNNAYWDSSHLGTNGWLLYDVAGITSNFVNLSLTPENWEDGSGGFFDTLLAGSAFSLFQDGNDIYLNFTAAEISEVVPEPGTFVLAALGLVGLGCFTWRRKTSSAAQS